MRKQPLIILADARAARGPAVEQDAEPGATLQRTTRMSPPQWVLPKNHQEIYQAVTDGLPDGLSITTEAPLTTVMELLTRPATRETLAHFINFDRQHTLSPFRVTVRKQFAGKIKSVLCFSPERDDPTPLTFQGKCNLAQLTAINWKRVKLGETRQGTGEWKGFELAVNGSGRIVPA